MSDVPASGAAARGGGLIEWFANNTVAANLIMLFMLIGGFVAGTHLTAQIFPTIDRQVINVRVSYPGATPSEVEEGITRRVEEAVFGIDGVERVVSKASENVGTVEVELKDFTDAARVRDDVEAAVQRIADFPPEDAEQPSIVRAETISNVMTMVVSSELPEAELRRGAERLEEELLALPSVSLVSLVGARDYEISIEVREEALRRHNLSVGQVADAVRRASLNCRRANSAPRAATCCCAPMQSGSGARSSRISSSARRRMGRCSDCGMSPPFATASPMSILPTSTTAGRAFSCKCANPRPRTRW